MPSTSTLSLETRWSKPLVSFQGGEADLLVRITAPAARPTRRAPLDIAFVIDRSGSMSGEPVREAKQAVNAAVERLEPDDRAAVVVFDSDVDLIHRLVSVLPDRKARIRRVLRPVEGRGSTNLSGGWLAGCQELAEHHHARDGVRLRRTILLTDGQANLGITDPDALAHHAGQLRRRGIATTTLGFGAGFDEQLLAAMAEAGGGNFEYIASARQLSAFFDRELGEMLAAAATNLEVQITFPEGIHAQVISRLPYERSGKQFSISIGDLPAGETVDLLLHLTIAPGREGDMLKIAAEAGWIATETGQADRCDFTPLPMMRTKPEVVAVTPGDPVVLELATIQRGAAAQRDALKLDRAGHHAEAHRRMQDVSAIFAAAPQTEAVLREGGEVQRMVEMDWSHGLSEDTRKHGVARSSRITRGRQEREPAVEE